MCPRVFETRGRQHTRLPCPSLRSCVCVLSRFSLVLKTLCNPTDHSHQAPLSMGFSRQEYWSGLPCPPAGDLPDPGIEPVSLVSCIGSEFFITSATWEAISQSLLKSVSTELVMLSSYLVLCPPPVSFCLQSFPASESFPMSWLFTSVGQSIEASASASVLPVNIQD